jgi:hypothetical protein
VESSRATRASALALALASLTSLAAACGSSFEGAPEDGSGGAGAFGSNGTPSGNGSGGAGSGLPCDVAAVLATNCGECHTSPPKYGAPMPLADLDDLHAAAESDPARKVWELVKERIADPVKPMPPSGDLPEADRAVLDAWLAAGAPAASDEGCGAGGAGSGGAGDVGPDALPCTPTHVFTAHAEGSDEAFHVPEQGADNLYQCFTFKSPFDGVTQATAWAPITDDERVLHHWILYRTKTAQVDGGVMPCAMPADATFVSGWAPGGTNFVLPENVGLELAGPEDWFILQVHYHNSAHHADALDRSGVALCTTDTPREHDAGIVTLGTVGIDVPPHAMGHEETGTCPSWITSYLTEPLHIIASFPHMHELGRKFRTDILRGGSESMVEPLVEVEHFSFDDQKYYAHEPAVLLHPGDAVRTTCTYDNPGNVAVKFGEKTEDEMCFNFAMVYPVSSIGDNRQCGLF